MKFSTLVLSAFVVVTVAQANADNFVTITPTGASAATVANRWTIGSDQSGLGYIGGNSGFPGATATNFFTIIGDTIPALGNPTGFTSYLPTGAATAQGSVGNALTPNSYSGLTYAAGDLGFGPLSFYAIHHSSIADYLALIKPGAPTVTDEKTMGSGNFALSYAEDNPGNWGANLFYYLRTDANTGHTWFGSMIPGLGSGPIDRFDLGVGGGYTDLAYTSTSVLGLWTSTFYYLRLDSITHMTFFGRIDPLTGVATDIQNLGGVYRTLVFTPTDVGYGANNFYSIGQSAQAQTITFASIPGHTACDSAFTVNPTSTSGLPVTLVVTSGPATVSGNTVTLTGTGNVTLQATQAGNTSYAAAIPVSQTFAVTACAAPQTITFATVPSHTACDASFTFVYPTASSGLPVTLAVSGPATVSGGNVVTLTGAVGTVILTATQAGNASYAAATPVSQTFAVTACATPQTITFAAVPDQGLCNPSFTVNPTSSSGLPVTLVVTSGPAMISGNTVTITGPGTVILTATQAGNTSYAAATPVSQTFAAVKCEATISLSGLTESLPFHDLLWVIATTTPGGLPVIVTYNGDNMLPAVAGSYTIVATIDSPIYMGTTTGTIVLTPDLRVAQTVSFGSQPIPNHVFGDAPFTLTPTSSSGQPVVLSVKSGPATVSGNTVTLTGAGTVVLEITQSGNAANTLFAYQLQSFDVAPATVPIALSGLTQNFDGSPKRVIAIATPAGLKVNLTYNGSAAAPSAAGSYAVQATVNDSNYQGVATALFNIISGRIVNFSTRALSGPNNPLIMGFVVSGDGENLLVRGIGPTLTSYGISNVLSDPLLTLYSSNGVAFATNDNWQINSSGQDQSTLIATTASRVGAFALPNGSKDSALLVTVNSGAYTTSVLGTNSTSGVALTEIYDTDATSSGRLINVSARFNVTAGEGSLVAGLVIAGTGPKTMLIRAVGPTLSTFGVTGVLSDPIVTVFSGNTQIATNANWATGPSTVAQISAAAAQVGAFPLPVGSKDSALLISLQPGAYSVQVTGAGNTTGVALIEVYDTQ